jgi:hypothetical protein
MCECECECECECVCVCVCVCVCECLYVFRSSFFIYILIKNTAPPTAESITSDELRLLLLDVNQPLSEGELARLMERMDTNHDGCIDFDEFATSMIDLLTGRGIFAVAAAPAPLLKAQIQAADKPLQQQHNSKKKSSTDGGNDNDDDDNESAGSGSGEDDDEDEEEMPEEFKPLTVEQQQTAIKRRAALYMGVGTVLVVVFADAISDIFASFGDRLNIGAFYISCVWGWVFVVVSYSLILGQKKGLFWPLLLVTLRKFWRRTRTRGRKQRRR